MKTIIKVALISLLWMMAVNQPLIAGDTLSRLNITHALWTGIEEISLPPDYKPTSRLDNIGVVGVGGKRYFAYDMGQPLLMFPGDWLGTQIYNVSHKSSPLFWRRLFVNYLIFLPLNILTVVACFWLLRLLDFQEKIAGLASLAWLLTTTVLHYAQVNQQNHQVLLFVILGYGTVLSYVKSGKWFWIFLSGLSLGAALLIRMTSFIHVLTVLGFLLGCIIYKNHDKVKIIKVISLWILGLVPGIFVIKLFDYLRFGSIWKTAASLSQEQWKTDPIFAGLPEIPANYPFINPPYIGIWGVLLSPAKSIFIYDPLLLPCLGLGIFLWKKLSPYVQWYLVTAVFNLIFYIIFTSRLDFWHGDAAWGARYHVTSVHLILIPLIALLIERFLAAKKLIRWLITGLLTLSLMVQITSVILRPSADTGRIYGATNQSFLKFRLGWRVKNIGCLINSSAFPDCPQPENPNQPNPLLEKASLFPFYFTNNRGLVWALWGLILITAIVSTVRFCLLG